MDIVQTFYDSMASKYDKLFENWQSTTEEQANILSNIFEAEGFDRDISLLDCACGIGTQAVGLAGLGYKITASDISENELNEARKRALENKVNIRFETADFRKLSDTFNESFHIIICMDNALPHMLTAEDLNEAVKSISEKLNEGGIFVASIRDYDTLLNEKPPYSPPYIHKTENGQRVSFQTWQWDKENYKLTQYIIEDENTLNVSKFDCEYRAVKREELTALLLKNGCSEVKWKFTGETGFYQPIVIARK